MGEVTVHITPNAEDDIRQIFEYLSEYSLSNALSQVDSFLEKFELLKKFPRLGKVITRFNNEQLREFYSGKYRIAYYIVSDSQIDILRVHHTARPLEFE